jgi:hypothetical protein
VASGPCSPQVPYLTSGKTFVLSRPQFPLGKIFWIWDGKDWVISRVPFSLSCTEHVLSKKPATLSCPT